ncbi:hypothetical protein Tco_1157013 [Tanacetum coccineum]
MNTPSKEDLDNLFGPIYEEYFEKRSSEVSINSVVQQVHNHEDSPSTSLIIVEEHKAPPIVTTSEEQTSPILMNEADELNQEDSAEFDGNTTFELKNIKEAMSDHSWIESMQDELHQFKRLDVWELVPRPDGKNIIVEEGINFEESIAVACLEAVRSRPDIAFAIFICARYQARPTVKHLKEVKRIFRYLRLSYNIGLWYSKDFRFELIAYSDADHAGCKDDCRSTSGGL